MQQQRESPDGISSSDAETMVASVKDRPDFWRPSRPHKRKPLRPLDKRKPIVVPLPRHREEELPQTTRAAIAHFTWMLPWRRTT